MAIIRTSANAIRRGRVGDTTYYYRNGQQVARQSRNNSNYGGMATRLPVQQANRVKWANLVNFFKVSRVWMKGAFESKKQNQTDYNAFMARNKSASPICLNKTQAAQSCCCAYPYIISQGSLAPVGYTFESGSIFTTDLLLPSGFDIGTATIKTLSEAIIANNVGFQNGDNLAFITYGTRFESTVNPYTTCVYLELTLDTSNTATLASHPLGGLMNEDASRHIIIDATGVGVTGDVSCALVHTRIDGGLKVSSQTLLCSAPTMYAPLTTDAWEAECAASYGVDEEVPLEPTE